MNSDRPSCQIGRNYNRAKPALKYYQNQGDQRQPKQHRPRHFKWNWFIEKNDNEKTNRYSYQSVDIFNRGFHWIEIRFFQYGFIRTKLIRCWIHPNQTKVPCKFLILLIAISRIILFIVGRKLVNRSGWRPGTKTLGPIGAAHARARTSYDPSYQDQKINSDQGTQAKPVKSPDRW